SGINIPDKNAIPMEMKFAMPLIRNLFVVSEETTNWSDSNNELININATNRLSSGTPSRLSHLMNMPPKNRISTANTAMILWALMICVVYEMVFKGDTLALFLRFGSLNSVMILPMNIKSKRSEEHTSELQSRFDLV